MTYRSPHPLNPAPTPTLDRIADAPATAASLHPATVVALLGRAATVHAALTARLAHALLEELAETRPGAATEDALLTAKQAAAIANVTPRWLYRNAKRLPFSRRLSPKVLRFSEPGLRKWLMDSGS